MPANPHPGADHPKRYHGRERAGEKLTPLDLEVIAAIYAVVRDVEATLKWVPPIWHAAARVRIREMAG